MVSPSLLYYKRLKRVFCKHKLLYKCFLVSLIAFKGFGYVPSVLFSLFYTFGKKIFYLTVDGTKIVLRPRGEIFI